MLYMDISFQIISNRLVSNKFQIITAKPLVGQFINSYFIWDDDFERLKEKLFLLLRRTDYKNLQTMGLGTYDDIFIYIIRENNERKVRLFVGMDKEYESITEIKIDLKEFKEILDAFIREKAEFEKDPEAYKEKLKREGGIVEE